MRGDDAERFGVEQRWSVGCLLLCLGLGALSLQQWGYGFVQKRKKTSSHVKLIKKISWTPIYVDTGQQVEPANNIGQI